jgi:hypothetical protein
MHALLFSRAGSRDTEIRRFGLEKKWEIEQKLPHSTPMRRQTTRIGAAQSYLPDVPVREDGSENDRHDADRDSFGQVFWLRTFKLISSDLPIDVRIDSGCGDILRVLKIRPLQRRVRDGISPSSRARISKIPTG